MLKGGELSFSRHITYGSAVACRHSVHCFHLYVPVTLASDTSSIGGTGFSASSALPEIDSAYRYVIYIANKHLFYRRHSRALHLFRCSVLAILLSSSLQPIQAHMEVSPYEQFRA